jgi:hypothetical protein
MKSKWLLVPIFSLLAVGCAANRAASPESFDLLANKVMSHGCDNPEISKRPVPNRYVPDVIDQIQTTHCEGILSETYLPNAATAPARLPVFLEVTKPNRELPEGVNIGSSKDQLLKKLGTPSEQTASTVKYIDPKAENSAVTFILKNDAVTSVRWDWFID